MVYQVSRPACRALSSLPKHSLPTAVSSLSPELTYSSQRNCNQNRNNNLIRQIDSQAIPRSSSKTPSPLIPAWISSLSITSLSSLLRNAAAAGDLETVEMLVHPEHPNRLSIPRASKRLLLDGKDPETGVTSLMLACERDQWRVVKLLLQQGANSGARCAKGMNCFNYARAANSVGSLNALMWLSKHQEICMSVVKGTEDAMDPFKDMRGVIEDIWEKKVLKLGDKSKSADQNLLLSAASRNSYQKELNARWKKPKFFGEEPEAHGEELDKVVDAELSTKRIKMSRNASRRDEWGRILTPVFMKGLKTIKKVRLKHVRAQKEFRPLIDNSNCGYPKWKDNKDGKDGKMLTGVPILNYNLRSPDLKFQGGSNPGYWPLVNAAAHKRPVKSETRTYTMPHRSRNRPNMYHR